MVKTYAFSMKLNKDRIQHLKHRKMFISCLCERLKSLLHVAYINYVSTCLLQRYKAAKTAYFSAIHSTHLRATPLTLERNGWHEFGCINSSPWGEKTNPCVQIFLIICRPIAHKLLTVAVIVFWDVFFDKQIFANFHWKMTKKVDLCKK